MDSTYSLWFTFIWFAACASLYVQSKPVSEIQESRCLVKLNSTFPIDVCDDRIYTEENKKTKIRDYIKEFVKMLKNTAELARKEMESLSVKDNCDISNTLKRSLGKVGLKYLNPTASKKPKNVLGITRKSRKARQLLETTWWLTSMLKVAHELNLMDRLTRKDLICQLEDNARYIRDIISIDMQIIVPEKSSVCYREQSIVFPLTPDHSKTCKYAYLAISDIYRGLKHMIGGLRNCRISAKKRNGTKKPKLRCRKIKSVFYPKSQICRGKRNRRKRCGRRRKLISWM